MSQLEECSVEVEECTLKYVQINIEINNNESFLFFITRVHTACMYVMYIYLFMYIM